MDRRSTGRYYRVTSRCTTWVPAGMFDDWPGAIVEVVDDGMKYVNCALVRKVGGGAWFDEALVALEDLDPRVGYRLDDEEIEHRLCRARLEMLRNLVSAYLRRRERAPLALVQERQRAADELHRIRLVMRSQWVIGQRDRSPFPEPFRAGQITYVQGL